MELERYLMYSDLLTQIRAILNEKDISRLPDLVSEQQQRVAELEAQVATLRAIAGELLSGWSFYCEMVGRGSGQYCTHCAEYYSPDLSSEPARDHGDKCPVRRLAEVG